MTGQDDDCRFGTNCYSYTHINSVQYRATAITPIAAVRVNQRYQARTNYHLGAIVIRFRETNVSSDPIPRSLPHVPRSFAPE